jgi:hypothetical protein
LVLPCPVLPRARRLPFVLPTLLGLALLAPAAAALDAPVPPVLPSSAAQGGSSVAIAEGWDALFSNPAGFRSEPGEVTLLSLNPWLLGGLPWNGDLEASMLDQAASGGVRLGGLAGIGYSGRGLGLAFFLSSGAEIRGDSVLSGNAGFEIGLVGGYSYGLNILGVNVSLGASLRPLLRAEMPLDDATARSLIHDSAQAGIGLLDDLWSERALYGLGLAVDVGALVDLGKLRLGLLISDVGNTTFRYSDVKLGDLLTSVATLASLPEGRSTDEGVTVPMRVRLGAAYSITPALLVHGEIVDPIPLLLGDIDPIDSVHLGLQLAVGKKAHLWAGYEASGFTAGASWRLGPFETSIAAFGLDPWAGASSPVGIAAETALRF